MEGRAELEEKFAHVNMFTTCEQCGVCSSACPISGVEGFNIRRIIRYVELGLIEEVASSPLPWKCTTCGRCEEACPNGIAILDIVRSLRSLSPEASTPDASPPCTTACAAGIDVPGYLRLIEEGRPDEANALILEKVPFPGILGRVCPHPCEDSCRRGEVNKPISICALKRFAADKDVDLSKKGVEVKEETGKSVAVVGAGPAGLTAALYLRKKGHCVTLLESRSQAGGMMRYGVPEYRLPSHVIDREINRILGVGIELRVGKTMGADFDLKKLRSEGFGAVFLAPGLQLPQKIDIEGIELKHVFWGVDFLRDVNEGNKVSVGDDVLVVGGGGVAVDVALTALRVGAKDVTLACLEGREEMPTTRQKIEQALKEGVRLMTSWGPKRIIGDNGEVSSVDLVKCASVFDESGNFCPTFEEDVRSISVTHVILATGQKADLSSLGKKAHPLVEKGLILVDGGTQSTSVDGVFAGGDVTGGSGSIIEAVAAGRRAAKAIDRYLEGDGKIEETLGARTPSSTYRGVREKGFADLERVKSPTSPLEERRTGFEEVEVGLRDDQAIGEAKRCLQCDLEWMLAKKSGGQST